MNSAPRNEGVTTPPRGDLSVETGDVAGIAQASAPCFYPEDENGHAFEWGDGTPHWTTASEAWRMLGVIRRDDRGLVLRLRRATEPCWHIACDECGYRYDEDEWCCHFDSRSEAQANADDSGWVTIEGRLLCESCSYEVIGPPAQTTASERPGGDA